MSLQPSRGTGVVLTLFAALFLGVADNQVLSPLLPEIRADVGRPADQLGVLFTGYAVCAGFSVLLWGPLSDIFGRRQGLITGLGIFALGSSVSFLAHDFWTLLSGRLVTGTGASMLSLNAISYAADFFPYSRRGWAMGSIFSSYFAALILGVPVGAWVSDQLGWNMVFGLVGATSLALIVIAWWKLPPLESSAARTGPGRVLIVEQARTYLRFFTARRTLGGLLSSFSASAGITGFMAFLGVWLHDEFGISGKQTGLVFFACGSAALLASPFAGSLSDRIGKRIQFVLSNLLMAFFLLMLPRMAWEPVLFAGFSGVSLAAAFRQGPMEALLTEMVASGSRGSFIALKNAFSQLGIALSALLSGVLIEGPGYGAVCVLCAGFNVLAAASILSLIGERDL